MTKDCLIVVSTQVHSTNTKKQEEGLMNEQRQAQSLVLQGPGIVTVEQGGVPILMMTRNNLTGSTCSTGTQAAVMAMNFIRAGSPSVQIHLDPNLTEDSHEAQFEVATKWCEKRVNEVVEAEKLLNPDDSGGDAQDSVEIYMRHTVITGEQRTSLITIKRV